MAENDNDHVETQTHSEFRSELEKYLHADQYNLNPNFFIKHENELKKIREDVEKLVIGKFNYKRDPNNINNPMEEMRSILVRTIELSRDRRLKESELFGKDNNTTSSGIRSIVNDSSNMNLESSVIQSFSRMMNNTFGLINEYRSIIGLVPELKKVIRMIVRDTINANQVTKRSLIDLFKDNASSYSENQLKAMNMLLQTHVIDKYKLEEKQFLWFNEAFGTGAKPVAVFSYRDIIEQAVSIEKDRRYRDSGRYSNESIVEFENLDFDAMSREELSDLGVKIGTSDSSKRKTLGEFIYKPKISQKPKYKATEEDEGEEYVSERDEAYNDIISNESVDAIFEMGMEELYNTREELIKKQNMSNFTSYSTEGISDYALSDSIKNIDNTISKIETGTYDGEDKEKEEENQQDEVLKIKKRIRKKLEMLVDGIDRNIEVVKDNATAYAIGQDFLNLEKRYRKYGSKNNITSLDFDFENKEALNNKKKKSDINDILHQISGEESVFNHNSLIVEYDPEFVIPVSLGSTHLGYYVYEYEAVFGSEETSKRRSTSFTQLIKSTGYGDDNNVISMANGMYVSPNDPSNSSVFSPLGMTGSPSNLLNGLGMSDASNERINILKEIVLKTVSKRLEDPDLVDNKAFKDSIMGLIRQGYIIDKQIQFTFIPASNMVYFAPNLDDKGNPHSILDGTLLIWYMYLSSIMSSLMIKLMKSSDKEKLEINMGLSGQMGYTLSEIQKSLSTRSIHMRSFFDNIGTVLSNSAVYQRLTVPVFGGNEKLYDITPLEKVNDYSIDDDYTTKLMTSGIGPTGAPPTIFNSLSEAEFSRSVITNNLEYLDYTIERQNPMSKQMTKLIRILALNENIPIPDIENTESAMANFDPLTYIESCKNSGKSKEIEYIDVRKIEHVYRAPMNLNMTNISETFSAIEPVIDNFVKYCFGEDIEDTITKTKVAKLKKELMKQFAQDIDLNYIDEMADRLSEYIGDEIIEKAKNKVVSDNLDSLNGDGSDF